MKKIALSIRDFALPVPRIGSIEANSGFGRSAQEGQEIHLDVQGRRKKQDPLYDAEVTVSRSFARDGFEFTIGGRIDGLFRHSVPKIEEIKTSFSAKELKNRLLHSGMNHPYVLQLLTYGYFYSLDHDTVPLLSFHLVSSRSREAENMEVTLDLKEYETWMDRRMDELVREARLAEKRAARRRKVAAELSFPFEEPRLGQRELIARIEKGMGEPDRRRRRLLVQAPTGLGKTVGVLYPTLKEALARGQRVIYVTPKNSQHAVAEDAIDRFEAMGVSVKSLTITAKSKICFQNEPICDPKHCEYARDYYTKLDRENLLEKISRKRSLTQKTFTTIGREFEVCPFELQLDSAEEADVIICDYNYVFAPRSAFGRMTKLGLDQEGQPSLVIDEAHNLPSRAMDYYSPKLSTLLLERMREEVRELPSRFAADAEVLLNECIETLTQCRPTEKESEPDEFEPRTRPRYATNSRGGLSAKIDPPAHLFRDQDERLRTFLWRYLGADVEIQPGDVILRLSRMWSEFTDALEFTEDPTHPEFFTTYHEQGQGSEVRITCCDASQMLAETYDSYDQVVGFSATLKPFDFYAKLSGLSATETQFAEFQSPFPAENRKVLIIPQISTKYSDRERSMPRIAETIEKVVDIRPGNYFAFFPSFDFMERACARFRPPEGFKVLKQEREMRAPQVQAIVEGLKAGSDPTVIFAVQGGVFSEGVDYPGEAIVGAFIVGPPLPSFDLEREEMRGYYEKEYESGFDYAYTYPAMSKAIQAAGRVIRSETDRGLIVLMDNRFLHPSYAKSMPSNWFAEMPNELVSQKILQDVKEFWYGKGGEKPPRSTQPQVEPETESTVDVVVPPPSQGSLW